MTWLLLRCRTSNIRSSALVQTSCTLSMVRTRAWPRGSLHPEFYFRNFFARVFEPNQFKRSASADIIWVTWRASDDGEQTTWIKQSLLQRYVYVGCQLNSDHALRLLCLKGHVRARDSMYWRHRWQQASEFLCTNRNSFWREVRNRKKRPKPSQTLSLARY